MHGHTFHPRAWLCAAALLASASHNLLADQETLDGGRYIHAWVHSQPEFPPLNEQETPVTCWAASFSNLLQFYDINLPESDIVTQITGQPRLSNPGDMTKMLNSSYTDKNGVAVTVSSRITDNFWHSAHDISNQDILSELSANRPVFFSDSNHCMVVVDATFRAQDMAATDAVAADPAEGDYRHLSGQEIHGMLVAVVKVESGAGGNVPSNPGMEKQKRIVLPWTLARHNAEQTLTLENALPVIFECSKDKYESITDPNGYSQVWVQGAEDCSITDGSFFVDFRPKDHPPSYRTLVATLEKSLVPGWRKTVTHDDDELETKFDREDSSIIFDKHLASGTMQIQFYATLDPDSLNIPRQLVQTVPLTNEWRTHFWSVLDAVQNNFAQQPLSPNDEHLPKEWDLDGTAVSWSPQDRMYTNIILGECPDLTTAVTEFNKMVNQIASVTSMNWLREEYATSLYNRTFTFRENNSTNARYITITLGDGVHDSYQVFITIGFNENDSDFTPDQ